MAITALVKSSTLVLMPTDPATGKPDKKGAKRIEVSGAPTFSDSYDTIERDVVRQAFSTYAPLRGLETTSGTVTLELHGSGEPWGPPESNLLWKSAMGALIAPTHDSSTPPTWWQLDKQSDFDETTNKAYNVIATKILTDFDSADATEIKHTGATPTISYSPKLYKYKLKVALGIESTNPNTYYTLEQMGFEINFPLRVMDKDSNALKVIGFITALEPSTAEGQGFITIITEVKYDTAITSIVVDDKVDCGWLYSLHKQYDKPLASYPQVLATPEANFDYFRGDIVKESWYKALATEFSIDFSTGQVCLPSFNWEGTQVAYSDTHFSPGDYPGSPVGNPFDSTHDNNSPLVVQLADIYMEDLTADPVKGPIYFQECITNVQLTLTNEVFKKECIASTGIGEVLRTSRSVTGSLNTFYTGSDFQMAFKNDTKYNLRAVFNYSDYLDADTGEKHFRTLAGNIVAISIPLLKFSEVGIEEDTGIFKYANSFSCEPDRGDDEFLIAFM